MVAIRFRDAGAGVGEKESLEVEDASAGREASGGGRRARKKLEVRDRIRRAAMELFREKGYEATTVEEIAERADVAKGTFFNYFARKDALVAAVAEEMMEEIAEELGPREGWTGTAREQILRWFLALGASVERDPEVTKEMMIENLRSYWLRREPTAEQEAFEAVTRGVLRSAIARGELPVGTEVEIAAKLLEAAHITTIVDWLKAGTTGERYREELTKKVDIVFRGLSAVAPREQGRSA